MAPRRTTRRRLPRAALLLALGAPASVSPEAPATPLLAPDGTLAVQWAAAGCEAQLAQARAEIVAQEVEASGPPRPFAEGDPDEALVRAELADRLAEEPEVPIVSVDCSEYPCLVYATGYFSGSMPGWQQAPTIDARTIIGIEGAPPQTYVVYARLRLGDALDAWIPSAQDPELSLHVQARLERGLARLAEQAGGRVANRADLARLGGEDERAVAFWEAEAARMRAIGPAARPPSRCGAALDDALDALDRGRHAAGLVRTPLPADLPPEWQPEAVEARFEAAADECPEVGAAYLGVDCSEFPCVTMWLGPEPEELAACPRLATPAPDRASWSAGAFLRDAEGEDVMVGATAYGPPGWYAESKADPTANARMPRRLQELLIEARAPLGLRGPDAVDQALERVAGYEDLAAKHPSADATRALEEARAVRDALLEALEADDRP